MLLKCIGGLCAAGLLCAISLSAAAQARLDLNGDGKSEVLWENISNGHRYARTMNGLQVASEGAVPAFSDGNWRIAGFGDTNGDGKTDIVWRNTVTGENHLWTMNGLSVIGQTPLRSLALSWRVAGVADVNGDGRADILWRHYDSGENYVWFMTGSTVTSEGALPTVPVQWTLAGIGDVNGDGRADVIWRRQATGDNYLWTLNGLNVTSETALAGLPPAWLLSGMADYNGDGTADAIWGNAETGENYAWFMNGTAIGTQGFLPTVADVNWKMSAFGDYNGDGRADVLWRHATTGHNYLWLMNGAAQVSDGFLLPTQSRQAATPSGGGGGPSSTQASTAALGISAPRATPPTLGAGAPNTKAATMPAASSAPASVMTDRLDFLYGDSARWTAPDGRVFGIVTEDAVFNGTTDHIFNWGYNIGAVGSSPVDPTEPYLYFSMESDYNAGTDRLMEYHLNYLGVGTTGVRRPFAFNISRITHKSHWGFLAEDFFFGNSDQSRIPVNFDFAGTPESRTVTVTPVNAAATGLTIYGASGQTANVLETRNTIGSAGNVPTFYVKHDASGNGALAVSDRLGRENVVIPGDGTGIASFKVASILMAKPSNGGQVRLSGNNGVGSITLETNAYTPVFQFLNMGVNAILGDNRDIVISPNSTERIRFGAPGGSGSKVAVTGALTASSTIKPASFTVGTLPSASEAGAGATAYASNGRRSGEGPGAGTGIPVWSDGTTWRTYYNNTVVAQ